MVRSLALLLLALVISRAAAPGAENITHAAARLRLTLNGKWSTIVDPYETGFYEFGGSALQGMHGDRLTRFTEEFQADLYEKNVAMLAKIPQLAGMTPWILCDFRSPKRVLAGIQDGWNRKGLIGENGTKKAAFYVLKSFYDERALRP